MFLAVINSPFGHAKMRRILVSGHSYPNDDVLLRTPEAFSALPIH